MCETQECPITEEDVYSPGADIASNLVCLGNGVNESEILNQQMEAVRNTEGNPSTHVAGVYLHSVPYRQGSLALVRVELSEFPQTTIGELATALQMERRQVFNYILNWHQGPNRHVIDYLYRSIINGNETDRAQKILTLRDVMNGSPDENIPRYHRWRLPRRQNRRVLLPRSPEFQESVVNRRTALVTGRVTGAIGRLDSALDVVLEVARNLSRISERCGELLVPYQQEAGIINVMHNFMAIAERTPASSIDSSDYNTLQAKIVALKDEAHDKFTSEPTQTIAQQQRQIRNLSNSLYEHLQNPDSELNQAIAAIVAQENTVLPSYINEACQKLSGCYRVLCRSRRGEDFIRNGLMPVLEFIAQQNDNEPTQATFARFRTGIGAAAAWLSYIPTIAGNLPGPPSLLMVAIESSISITIKIGAGQRAFALLFQNNASTTLGRLLGVTDDNMPAFSRMLRTSDANELMTWRASLKRGSSNIVNSEVMNSPGWGVFMSVVSGFLFLNAVCQASQWNEASISTRIRLAADVAGTAANTLLSVGVAMRNSGRIAQLAPGASLSNRLGLFAAIAATVSSSAVLYEEYNTQDYTGATIAFIGVASGLLAVAGWLAVMGVITSWAGIGEVLLVLSFVLAIVAGVLSWITGDTNSDALFEALVQNLKEQPKFSRFCRNGSGHGGVLNRKFLEVELYHHSVEIQDMTNAARPALEALFGIDQITDRSNRESMQEAIDSVIA
ncbi:hypothetical protein [Glaciecola sp. MF2-115]|uniref:hypothetical protein n=1 Tax=Glaciecola sp. MF2-115 TaxID=3384827 RepID=UPI0039A113E2